MGQKLAHIVGFAALAVLVAACDRNADPILMNVGANNGSPDEFGILPSKPLELPRDLAALPAPTPGGSNLTDPTPEADAIAALGGTTRRYDGPATEGGLVGYAARYGVDPSIRQTLAAEDLEFRRDNNGRILERLFNVNVYFKAYRAQSLDQHLELERYRRAGVRTVSAPPDPLIVPKDQ
jgi:hypothetical protein